MHYITNTEELIEAIKTAVEKSHERIKNEQFTEELVDDYWNFRKKLQNWQKAKNISSLHSNSVFVLGKFITYLFPHDQLITLDSDYEILEKHKNELVKVFLEIVPPGIDITIDHSNDSSGDIEIVKPMTLIDFASGCGWAEIFLETYYWSKADLKFYGKTSLFSTPTPDCDTKEQTIILKLGYGKPEDAPYINQTGSDSFYFQFCVETDLLSR